MRRPRGRRRRETENNRQAPTGVAPNSTRDNSRPRPQSRNGHHRHTGHEQDAESGLYNYGARPYSNQLGRFMTPDWSAIPVPIPYADLHDPQSLNKYSYVYNNPLRYVDPNGHDVLSFFAGLANAANSNEAAGIGQNDRLPKGNDR